MKSSIHDTNMRPLPVGDKKILLQHDYDFCSAVWLAGERYSKYFLFDKNGGYIFHEKTYNDWYIQVAISKLDKLTANRDLITPDIVLDYRYAIREAFNHSLDTSLRNPYDEPRNRNTIEGVRGYIKKIAAISSENELAQLPKPKASPSGALKDALSSQRSEPAAPQPKNGRATTKNLKLC